eukprot:CAMPEP_0177765476 /NCGR_PEP_ID=MMETSP0491_2-20121128/8013_1 /TAXON_ID=63592 /ORGANISM="Tetraselmis chuii, Strain PLY429" /LENGTH=283 /DNA_ID=CAMNT_0019281829 /DNA_START=306 /DNA_END=1156 /DNA_ORIENTATION=-
MGCGSSQPQGSMPRTPSPTQTDATQETETMSIQDSVIKGVENAHAGVVQKEDDSLRGGKVIRSHSGECIVTEPDKEASSKPLTKRVNVLSSGVSLYALLELGEQAAAWDPRATTRAVVNKFIIPATQDEGVTYLGTLPKSSAGMPRYYVVHAWGGLFQDLVAAVQSKLRNRSQKECFVWLDFMAVNQSAAARAGRLLLPALPTKLYGRYNGSTGTQPARQQRHRLHARLVPLRAVAYAADALAASHPPTHRHTEAAGLAQHDHGAGHPAKQGGLDGGRRGNTA